MRGTRLLCAIGVSLWAAVGSRVQAAPPVALSGALRAHVTVERFGIVTSIRGLPLGVRDGLQTLFGSQALDIAEPGAEFQVTDVIVRIRSCRSAGWSRRGARPIIASCTTARRYRPQLQVALFHWTPAATRFEWGGTAPGSLKTIDDVRNAILSGVIKSPARFW